MAEVHGILPETTDVVAVFDEETAGVEYEHTAEAELNRAYDGGTGTNGTKNQS